MRKPASGPSGALQRANEDRFGRGPRGQIAIWIAGLSRWERPRRRGTRIPSRCPEVRTKLGGVDRGADAKQPSDGAKRPLAQEWTRAGPREGRESDRAKASLTLCPSERSILLHNCRAVHRCSAHTGHYQPMLQSTVHRRRKLMSRALLSLSSRFEAKQGRGAPCAPPWQGRKWAILSRPERRCAQGIEPPVSPRRGQDMDSKPLALRRLETCWYVLALQRLGAATQRLHLPTKEKLLSLACRKAVDRRRFSSHQSPRAAS